MYTHVQYMVEVVTRISKLQLNPALRAEIMCTHTPAHTQELCLHALLLHLPSPSLYVYVCICIYVLWYTEGYIYTCSLCTKYRVCSVWLTIPLKHTSLPFHKEKHWVSI